MQTSLIDVQLACVKGGIPALQECLELYSDHVVALIEGQQILSIAYDPVYTWMYVGYHTPDVSITSNGDGIIHIAALKENLARIDSLGDNFKGIEFSTVVTAKPVPHLPKPVTDIGLIKMLNVLRWVTQLLFRNIRSDDHTLVLSNNVEIKMKGETHVNAR